MKKIALLCGVLLFALLWDSKFFSEASGRTLYVNNTDASCGGKLPCYNTLQAAVTAAYGGDLVQIQAGTYAERLTIDGKNNFSGATEASRIVIEADPALPPGNVTLRPPLGTCLNGQGVLIRRSKFVTLRGLTVTGAAGAGVVLLGGLQQNQAIHIERSRIFGNSSSNCPGGGIAVALGNPDTLILNTLIYGNAGNGITFADPGGGPHWIIQNTIYGNSWNGVGIVLGQTATLANNLITNNGQASGTFGGRYGISRIALAGQSPEAVQLLNNLICGNRLGEIQGPMLDDGDSDNLTPQGTEGEGVRSAPGCEFPTNIYADVNGGDELANSGDDDFSLIRGSPAIDQGMDPAVLGLNAIFNPLFQADYKDDATVRPQDGDYDRVTTFDLGALEFPGDVQRPKVVFLAPAENAFVRQTITVTAEAIDDIGVSSFTLTAGNQILAALSSPPLPAVSTRATALWNSTYFADGVLILTATATDLSGNSANSGRSIIIDNTPPDTQIIDGPPGQIAETTATFTFAGTDNLTAPGNLVFAWRIDGGAISSFSSSTTATLTNLASGPHRLEVIAQDLAGNYDPTPAVWTFTVRPGPTITIIDPPAGSIGTLVTISGTDFEPGGTQVSFNGAPAVVRNATATSITTTVPTNAASGLLNVITPQGSAARNFTVTTRYSFTMQASPSSVRTIQSRATAVLIQAGSDDGFSGLIQLTTGPLPSGVSAEFSTSALAPNNHSVLTLRTTSATPAGAHVIEIHASTLNEGQSITQTAIVTLNVSEPGQTVLVGQVRDGDDKPLPGVSIKLGGATLTDLGSSDAAGNLFIVLWMTGSQVFLIDGSSANTSSINYPTIPVTLTIEPAVVNELGYVPRLRGQPAAKLIPFVPGQATVITDPDLPGFKMTIPEGVRIIGWDGQPNNQFSVTTVPIDGSPLPPLQLPPGFEARQIYLFSFGKIGGGVPTGNISIDTPNDVGGLPGDKVDLYFFNEAPDGTAPNQWEKYGTGTVSADGTTIVSDINPATGLPYGMPRFCCGARTNIIWRFLDFAFGGPSGGARDSGKRAGEPVDTATGFFYVDKIDMVLPGRLPVVVTRTYRTNQTNPGPFGVGTSWPFDIALATPPNGSPDALILVSPGNRQDLLSLQPDITYLNFTSPSLRGAVLRGQILNFKDGTVWVFDLAGRLTWQFDRNGNSIALSRDPLSGRVVSIIESSSGRALTISYASAGIQSITDPAGKQVRYSYDALGRLETVTDPAGGVTRYTYDSANRMLTLTDPRGITFLTNEYDSDGRVVRQTQGDGGVWMFGYTSSASYVSQTTVTNPRGHATTYRFNAAGYQTSETDALGQTTTFERQPGTNLVLAVTDSLKRATRFAYDASGNVTRIMDPVNNVRSFTYDQGFGNATSVTDPLGNVSRFEYDNHGNLTAAVDPLGNRTTIAYNNSGDPISRTDPLGNVTTLTYDALGRLLDITDPLGNRSQRDYDEVFRLTSQTDARGKITRFSYDGLNHITRVVDALNGITSFAYDSNGNLLSITDARGNITAYAYDNMSRLAKRTDPVDAAESFEYDGMGNLTRHIDRKGQQASFAYDAIDRQIAANYTDGASTRFIYDTANRLVEAADSAGGIISNQYDSVDRLIAQITDLGTVSYEYDSIARRTRMKVPGQVPVTYGYDTASRLKQVTYGNQTVALDYDALGRRTQLTFPNGVSTEYQYDAASRLVALVYGNAGGVLGDLTYTYDKAGNRIGVGGSFARTLLPDPIGSSTYDAANRQLSFGNKTMTFDANGNLTSISDPSGITTLSWDARNRLVGMKSPSVSAAFEYDYSTRRAKKTFNGEITEYVYDGLNPVQEISRASISANNLTQLAIDGYFGRSDLRNGLNSTVLGDALGNTIAVTDPAGSIQTEYTYESFGKAVISGVPFTTPFQYTGRENDGISLYYYRARYYSPTLQRFLSEDPIELRWGDTNLYPYARNSPLKFTDPLGETAYCGSGWTSMFIPDSWWGKYDFTNPCKQHDDCYGTCGKPKRRCDEEFYKNMLTQCIGLSGIWLDDCISTAQTYHWAVNKFGLGAYNAAQKENRR